MRRLLFVLGQLSRKIGINSQGERHPAVLEMTRKIHDLGSIQFKVEFYPDGSWTAESSNIDGIITGSKDTKEIDEMIKDAIFTYFKISPYFVDDSLLRTNNEPITVEQKVWATR